MLIAFVMGCFLPIQAGVNNKLAKTIGSPVNAAFISFAVGLICLTIYLAVRGQLFFDIGPTRSQPFWIWTGGVFGAFFVSLVTFIVPQLGATLSFILIIAGQLVISLIIDQYGLFGVAVSAITAKKVAGILLVLLGVILIRKNS